VNITVFIAVQRCTVMVLAALLGCSTALGQSGETDDKSPDKTDSDVSVQSLLGDQITTELHDDSTILRDVNISGQDKAGVVILDALHIWLGGAVQYDYYNFDGIYNNTGEGDRREGGSMRRLEGTLRMQLYDWGELKAQYDFDQGIFRDLYLRWVSKLSVTPLTITVGNQKEPIGLDDLVGNKFSIAQERSAPSHAFGTWRSLGVRFHRAFELGEEESKLKRWDDEGAFVTTSVGVFTEDIEQTNNTDRAFTGRVTVGQKKADVATHLGVSASYREGDFFRISMRPEVREADRVTLARPQANTLAIVGLEAIFNKGAFHLQAEAFASSYRGRLDGYGGGGYIQAGWYVTGESRSYNPRWGLVSPHAPGSRPSVEVFSRLSHTRGEDDDNGWNDYKSLTVGTNVYYRKVRGSINILYGESRAPIVTEDEGVALIARIQYLF
jgi:phosphate-selective porin